MNLELLLNSLTDVKDKSNGGYKAICPCHDDSKPSLYIDITEEGKPLLYCQACHAGGDDVLKALNLTWKDILPGELLSHPRPEVPGQGSEAHRTGNGKSYTTEYFQQKAEKYFIYTSPDGKPLHLVARFSGKKFCQYRNDGNGGWLSGIKDIKPVLYRLPEVLKSEKIFIVEGEKDCESLKAWGLTATTCPMGAGKWRSEFSAYFTGKKALILPDNDEVGKKHAIQAAESIMKAGGVVKIINLPGLEEKEDVTDWIEKGGTKKQLFSIIKKTALYKPEEPEQKKDEGKINDFSVQDLLSKEFPAVKYFIEDILPEGLTVLAGSPKIGKSFIALNAFFSIANGEKVFGKLDTRKSGVAYFALEDPEKRLHRRIKNMLESNPELTIPENARIANNMKRLEEGGFEQLYEYIASHPEIELIIIDTLQRVRKPTLKGNPYEVDTEILSRLHKVYLEKGVSILVIHHTKKAKSGDFLCDISGSQGIAGVSDTIMVLDRERLRKDGTLKVTGRDIDDGGKELAMKFDDYTLSWIVEGDAELFDMGTERREIIDLFLSHGNKALKAKEIAELLDKKENTIRKMTGRMVDKGILIHLGRFTGYNLSSEVYLKSMGNNSNDDKNILLNNDSHNNHINPYSHHSHYSHNDGEEKESDTDTRESDRNVTATYLADENKNNEQSSHFLNKKESNVTKGTIVTQKEKNSPEEKSSCKACKRYKAGKCEFNVKLKAGEKCRFYEGRENKSGGDGK